MSPGDSVSFIVDARLFARGLRIENDTLQALTLTTPDRQTPVGTGVQLFSFPAGLYTFTLTNDPSLGTVGNVRVEITEEEQAGAAPEVDLPTFTPEHADINNGATGLGTNPQTVIAAFGTTRILGLYVALSASIEFGAANFARNVALVRTSPGGIVLAVLSILLRGTGANNVQREVAVTPWIPYPGGAPFEGDIVCEVSVTQIGGGAAPLFIRVDARGVIHYREQRTP